MTNVTLSILTTIFILRLIKKVVCIRLLIFYWLLIDESMTVAINVEDVTFATVMTRDCEITR